MKAKDWQELTHLTQGAPILIERVRLVDSDIAIEGAFDLPPLARLSAEDQVFVMAFVRAEGSIKEMEKIFGVSYPDKKSTESHFRAITICREHYHILQTGSYCRA